MQGNSLDWVAATLAEAAEAAPSLLHRTPLPSDCDSEELWATVSS
jgi:hypothetical protein